MHFRHNEWVHVNCALWSSEVYEEVDGSLQNVGQALTRGLKLNCTLCSKKGASIGKNTTFQRITISRVLSLTSGLGSFPFCVHFRFVSTSGLCPLPVRVQFRFWLTSGWVFAKCWPGLDTRLEIELHIMQQKSSQHKDSTF